MGYFALWRALFYFPAEENFATIIDLMYMNFKIEIILNIWA